MPVADWETRLAILTAMYARLGTQGWFDYRHGRVCMIPRNGISKPARWVKQPVFV